MIVTTLDTFTSLMAGITIFGILGNLAHNLGVDDIRMVVKSGSGLAFISYPDAIAKFDFLPQVNWLTTLPPLESLNLFHFQVFSVLFFFMLFVLGLGSVVALQSVVVTVICDQFRSLRFWKVAAATSFIGFLLGLVYTTPGGQWMLNLVDYYGGTLLIFFLSIFELSGLFWVYGVDNFCLDIEFMTGRKVSFYWRFCWGFFTPVFMLVVFVYSMWQMKPLQYSGFYYPTAYYVFGWALFAIGCIQLPLWFLWAYSHESKLSMLDGVRAVFAPSKGFGPADPIQRQEWIKFREEAKQRRLQSTRLHNLPRWRRKLQVFLGKY